MNLRTKKTLLFIGLTFLLDWLMVLLYVAMGGKDEEVAFLAAAYMFMPMAIAFVVQKGIFKEPVIQPLGISFRINSWFFVAWFLPVVIAFAVMGASLLLPGVRFTPDMSGFLNTLAASLTPDQMDQVRQQLVSFAVHPIWLGVLVALIAGTTINAVLGFGEEVGWRGFLLKQLGFMGFWKSSLLIGFIWGIWHAPLILLGFNYPDHPQAGVMMMVAWVIVISPLFSYIRLKARSVIASSVFHGTINAVPLLAVLLITGGNDLTVGITGLAGIIVFALVDICLFIFDRFITKEPVNRILKNI
ncbi:MAG: CPBP family intramembrane glutamic endopeptidase [Dehalococcoidia bacterium]|jgi:membrane protease YdiL (CAAX protease family)